MIRNLDLNIDLIDLAAAMCLGLPYDEVLEFIKAIDKGMGDSVFTDMCLKYFAISKNEE